MLTKGVSSALLKTLGHNKDAPLPLKLFEISDVILIDKSRATGCRNERHLAAVYCSKASEFEVIHGLLNRVMEVLGVPLSGKILTAWRVIRNAAESGRWLLNTSCSEESHPFRNTHGTITALWELWCPANELGNHTEKCPPAANQEAAGEDLWMAHRP